MNLLLCIGHTTGYCRERLSSGIANKAEKERMECPGRKEDNRGVEGEVVIV